MLCRFALGTRAPQVSGIKVFKSAAQGGADADDVTVGSFSLSTLFQMDTGTNYKTFCHRHRCSCTISVRRLNHITCLLQ